MMLAYLFFFLVQASIVSSLASCQKIHTLYFKLLDFNTADRTRCDPSGNDDVEKCDFWVRVSTMDTKGSNESGILFDNHDNHNGYNIHSVPEPPHEFLHTYDENEDKVKIVVQFVDEDVIDFNEQQHYHLLKDYEKTRSIPEDALHIIRCLWHVEFTYNTNKSMDRTHVVTTNRANKNKKCLTSTGGVDITFTFTIQITRQDCAEDRTSTARNGNVSNTGMNGILIGLMVFTGIGFLIASTVILGIILILLRKISF